MRIDHADHVFQNGRFKFHQTIRRQATVTFANAHSPPRGMKAQAHFGCGSDGVIQARPIGEEVEVI